MDVFVNGFFTVQDEGAGEIVNLLEPQSEEIVLDACAAPGGKTTYMAEIMKNKGKILAWDLHEHRVNLINETAKRLEINIIQTEVKNASEFEHIESERKA